MHCHRILYAVDGSFYTRLKQVLDDTFRCSLASSDDQLSRWNRRRVCPNQCGRVTWLRPGNRRWGNPDIICSAPAPLRGQTISIGYYLCIFTPFIPYLRKGGVKSFCTHLPVLLNRRLAPTPAQYPHWSGSPAINIDDNGHPSVPP